MLYFLDKYAHLFHNLESTHLLRISSEHGVYGFDPLEQVGWDHIGGSAMCKTQPAKQSIVMEVFIIKPQMMKSRRLR